MFTMRRLATHRARRMWISWASCAAEHNERQGSRLSDLTVSTIQKYVTGKGNKASTVAREINSIKAMLAHAKAMGFSTPDLELVRPSVDDSRLRWLTESERDHLIASCSEEIRGIVTFLFFTGCRIGEALSLDHKM